MEKESKLLFSRQHIKKWMLILFMIFITTLAYSQKIAIKTNLLYDATTTFNLGAEFSLSSNLTLELSGNYNPWTFSHNKKWKHWLAQPEIRYWTCEKFNGHFWGVHLLGGQVNTGNIKMNLKLWDINFRQLKDHRFEGWFVGAGIAYGYSWILGHHWNLEGELGIGYLHTKYTKYKCAKCGEKLNKGDKNYLGPTKAAVNLIYVF